MRKTERVGQCSMRKAYPRRTFPGGALSCSIPRARAPTRPSIPLPGPPKPHGHLGLRRSLCRPHRHTQPPPARLRLPDRLPAAFGRPRPATRDPDSGPAGLHQVGWRDSAPKSLKRGPIGVTGVPRQMAANFPANYWSRRRAQAPPATPGGAVVDWRGQRQEN